MQEADAKLVQRCSKGDPRAWEKMVQVYSGRIYNMAYRYTNRFDVAQELTQEIFLKVYLNLSSYRPESGSPGNWIMRVGRNLIIDHLRANRRDRQVAGSDELERVDFQASKTAAGPFENLYLKEKAETLLGALNRLTPELREAVVLRDLEEFSYQEIAQILQIPEGTVKSRINRGRIELARVLSQSPKGRDVAH